MKKKTQEEFLSQVEVLVGDEYSFLDKYINATTKIKVQHNTCGYCYSVSPDKFINAGRRCPKCSNAKYKKKTHEEFVQEVKELTDNEYKVISNYIKAHTKVRMRHLKCNYEWETKPNDFLNGRRCPMCAGTIKKTNEQFKKEVFDLVGNEYEVLGSYVNSYTKIKLKHVICGNEYHVKPSSFVNNGNRCPYCAKRNRRVDK